MLESNQHILRRRRYIVKERQKCFSYMFIYKCHTFCMKYHVNKIQKQKNNHFVAGYQRVGILSSQRNYLMSHTYYVLFCFHCNLSYTILVVYTATHYLFRWANLVVTFYPKYSCFVQAHVQIPKFLRARSIKYCLLLSEIICMGTRGGVRWGDQMQTGANIDFGLTRLVQSMCSFLSTLLIKLIMVHLI